MTRRVIVIVLTLVLVVAVAPAGAQAGAQAPEPPVERSELRELLPPQRLFPGGTAQFRLLLPRTVEVCPGIVHTWTGRRAAVGRMYLSQGESSSISVIALAFDDADEAERALRRYHRTRIGDCGTHTIDGAEVVQQGRRSPFPDAGDTRRAMHFRSTERDGTHIVGRFALFRFDRVVLEVNYLAQEDAQPRDLWRSVTERTIDLAEAAFG